MVSVQTASTFVPAQDDCKRDPLIHGDCRQILMTLPENSVDLVFADPPYFLQLQQELYRPNRTKVNGVQEAWDQYDDFRDYDRFTASWLEALRSVLKPTATVWVSGSYHNIFRIGKIMQDLGYWILNDVIWVKHNPMPNFLGRRLTNAHETLIWAAKSKQARYYFDYQTAKAINDGLQLRSDWYLPICSGKERLRDSAGKTRHPTQKPLSLLNRIVLCASQPDDLVLDPFLGSGTTAVAAKQLNRRFIGIEQSAEYIQLARERLAQVKALDASAFVAHGTVSKPRNRIPFSSLLDRGWLNAGDALSSADQDIHAQVMVGGQLRITSSGPHRGATGTIHALAGLVSGVERANGWLYWNIDITNNAGDRCRYPLDYLRQRALESKVLGSKDEPKRYALTKTDRLCC